jgi:hypothetical protein
MEHKEVLNMYMLLLDDMDQYNSYIKNSVKAIVTRNASVKSSMSNLKIRNFF